MTPSARSLRFLLRPATRPRAGGAPPPDGAHSWGLCFNEEVVCDPGGCTQHCDGGNSEFPCTERVAGFGMTTNIINGGLECNQPKTAAVADRVGFFERYASIVGATVGANLYCDQMGSY